MQRAHLLCASPHLSSFLSSIFDLHLISSITQFIGLSPHCLSIHLRLHSFPLYLCFILSLLHFLFSTNKVTGKQTHEMLILTQLKEISLIALRHFKSFTESDRHTLEKRTDTKEKKEGRKEDWEEKKHNSSIFEPLHQTPSFAQLSTNHKHDHYIT